MYNSTPEGDFWMGVILLVCGIVFIIIPLCVMGGLGALLRHCIVKSVNKRYHGSLPFATLIVNMTSCFIMGLLVGAGAKSISHFSDVFDYGPWILTTGFCGGFSTFSSVALEVVKMLNEKLPGRGAYSAGRGAYSAGRGAYSANSENLERDNMKIVSTYAILIYIGLQMILPAMMTVLGYLLAARH